MIVEPNTLYKYVHSLTWQDHPITTIKHFFYDILFQLQVKVSTLEHQLAQEQAEKARLLEEHQQSLNRPEVKTVHSNSTATIEKLSEVCHSILPF